jgi:hypothetical protein
MATEILLTGAAASVAVIAAVVAAILSAKTRTGGLPPAPSGSKVFEHPPAALGPVARLTFTESLDPQRFATAAEAVAQEVLTALWRSALDGANVTLNGVRLLSSRAEMIVTASRNGRALIESGVATVPRHAASARLLPSVADPKTGKIFELMKEAPAARRFAQLTALSSMVVGAAHIIASADIAKKLRIIDGKLDALLAYRRIDQAALLERVYTSAKELSQMPPDETRRLELWRLRNELRQLRATWRREFHFHLSNIEEPANAGWLERQFNAVASIAIDREGEKHRRIHGKISEGQLQLTLIEYAMRLDQVLAVGSNTMAAFEKTLADELIEIRTVADLLETKASYITKKNKQFSVEPMIAGMRAMVEHYEAILPERVAADGPPPEPGRITLFPIPFAPSRASAD